MPAIANALITAGADVKVFALMRRNGLAQPAIEAAGLRFAVRDGGERDHLAALRWIDRELVDWGATHIWTSLSRATLLGQIAGRRRGLPVVSWQHNAFLKPWNERLLRWRRNDAALWVADSHEVAELTAKRLKIPAEDLYTWPIFRANPEAPQAKPWEAGQTLRMGSLGRLHTAKGYDILIAALAKMKRDAFVSPVPFVVEIAGEGALGDQLRAQVAAAGLDNVVFRGYLPDAQGFLASLHLYLQPSRREGFCIAAHEACQAGLPVVVSAVGEMPSGASRPCNDGNDMLTAPVRPARAPCISYLVSRSWHGR